MDTKADELEKIKRNLGKKVDVKFYAAKDGKKVVTGVLTDFTQDTFTIEINGESQTYRFDEIANCTPVIEF